jgi:hypothetical protein
MDASLEAYDAAATSLLLERALPFLSKIPVNG